MRAKTVVKILLLSVLQGLASSHAFAFGRSAMGQCSALFNEGKRTPIFYGALNRLIAQSQKDWSRASFAMERIGVEAQYFRQFQQKAAAHGQHFEDILSSVESIINRSDFIRPTMRETYFQVARLWLELWIAQPTQFQNPQHVLDFPQKISSLFEMKVSSYRQLLIQRQKLEDFSNLLGTLKADIQMTGTGDMSLRDLTLQTLANPNPKRKLSALEKKLVSMTESRRKEFLKSCLP